MPRDINQYAKAILKRVLALETYNATNPAPAGAITKVGTPLATQVGIFTGDGIMQGIPQFTADEFGLYIGTTNIQEGVINLRGSSGLQGGFINFSKGATGTGDLGYKIEANTSSFTILGFNSGNIINYESVGDVVTLGNATSTAQIASTRLTIGSGNQYSWMEPAAGFFTYDLGGGEVEIQPTYILLKADDNSTTKFYVDRNGMDIGSSGERLRFTTEYMRFIDGSGNYIQLEQGGAIGANYIQTFQKAAGNIALVAQNGVYRVKVTLSAAQVKAIGTTPITAIAGAGAGTIIQPISAFAVNTYGTVAFDTNALNIRTSGATNPLFIFDGGLLDATATETWQATKGTVGPNDLAANTNIVIDGTDSVATGDSTVDVYITYEIITL